MTVRFMIFVNQCSESKSLYLLYNFYFQIADQDNNKLTFHDEYDTILKHARPLYFKAPAAERQVMKRLLG